MKKTLLKNIMSIGLGIMMLTSVMIADVGNVYAEPSPEPEPALAELGTCRSCDNNLEMRGNEEGHGKYCSYCREYAGELSSHEWDSSNTCTVCGYSKPAEPAPVIEQETKEEKSEENTTVEVPVTQFSAVAIETVKAAKADSKISTIFMSNKDAVVPANYVQAIAESPNAKVNLQVTNNTALGLSSSSFAGLKATPLSISTIDYRILKASSPMKVEGIASDKKIVVMQPVAGATNNNTAVLYQFYGPENAGKVVSFYAFGADGKTRVLVQSVVYPNGYAAFIVPMSGFTGYAE